jgi:hypothetical protein
VAAPHAKSGRPVKAPTGDPFAIPMTLEFIAISLYFTPLFHHHDSAIEASILHREKTNRIIEIRDQRKEFFAVLEPGDCAIPGLTDAAQPRGK